jgi:hypothetical protein
MSKKTISVIDFFYAIVDLVREHRAVVEALTFVASIFLTMFGWWQLDLQCFPYVWGLAEAIGPHISEILPFWFMMSNWAYVMFFGWIFAGYATLMLLYLLKGKEIKKLRAEAERLKVENQ